MPGAPKTSDAKPRSASQGAKTLDAAAIAATRDSLTLADLESSAERNKQWGRWGPDDELGTLNHISAEAVAATAPLVRRGKAFALAQNFDGNGP